MDAEYFLALAAKQKDLALAYDWPFLKRYWDLACAPGDRYKTIPTVDIRGTAATINFERPLKVERLYNTYYNPVCYGIDSDQWNYRNSDLGHRSDPIQNWAWATNSSESVNTDQIEIWPIPSIAQTIRFSGQRNVLALTAGTDKADLDDYLLVYFVAADYLAFRNQANAPIVLKKAADHLIKLRAGYPSSQPCINFGRDRNIFSPPSKTLPLVLVAS
jgi:hypothetical protein